MTQEAVQDHLAHGRAQSFEAVVLGAGFAGLRMLYELRELGLTATALEEAEDVGGTWLWNRYPGCRTDTEAWYYCYSFSKVILDEWTWRDRYPAQPEMLRYLQFVADRLDLRKDVQLNTRVVSSAYDEDANTWTLRTADGGTVTCTYLITAAGLLSAPYRPPFPGLETFQGKHYLTGRWPVDRGVDFTGERVAIIGTGATGVQALPTIAHTAKHVTVFQRTATYVIPSRNYPLDEAQRLALQRDYPDMWNRTVKHPWGLPYNPRVNRVAADVSKEEQQRILERAWETGTFRFLFETFDDVATDPATNELVCEFVRQKIRVIVDDPRTAELLCPNDHTLGSKRPPLGHQYYETFNRDNVSLVDVKATPIQEITPRGLVVGGVEHEFDTIIFATGFDAITGALTQLDVTGRQGRTLKDAWADGPSTYLSVAVEGFPNMFMILGPQSPFAIASITIEHTVRFVGAVIARLEASEHDRIEATAEASELWGHTVQQALEPTKRVRGTNSWVFGANIPGKPHVVLQYFGGIDKFISTCEDVLTSGMTGFRLSSGAGGSGSAAESAEPRELAGRSQPAGG